MANKIEIIVEGIDRASGVFGRIGATLGRIAFATAAAGIALVSKGLVDSVKSAIDSENAIAGLNAVLTSTKGIAGVSMAALLDHANALQRVTKFSDEAINSGQAMLLTFTNIGSKTFPRATEAVLNLAEKFGSIEGAAVQVGKALQDPIAGVSALRRVGVMLSDAQEKQVAAFMAVNDVASAQKIILDELDVEFGGLARAMGETTAGKIAILTNQIDTLKESLGAAILPLVIKATEVFTKFIESADFTAFWDNLTKGDWKAILQQIQKVARELGGKFSEWAKNIDWDKIGGIILEGIEKIDWAAAGVKLHDGAVSAFKYIEDAAREMQLKEIVGQAWIGASEALASAVTGQQVTLETSLAGYVAFGEGVKNAIDTWTANTEQGIFNWAMRSIIAVQTWQANITNSIWNAISGIVPFIRTAISLWNAPVSEALRSVAARFYNGAAAWVQQAINAILSLAPQLLSIITGVMSSLKAILKPISVSISFELPNFERLAEIAAAGVALVNNALAGGSGKKSGKSTGGGGGSSGGGGDNVPQMADGGVVRGPASGFAAMLHGEEAVIPLKNGSVPVQMGGGGAGGVVINLTYAPAFSMADADEFQRQLLPFIRRGLRQVTNS